jgi:hypothetical protein
MRCIQIQTSRVGWLQVDATLLVPPASGIPTPPAAKEDGQQTA